MTVSRMHRVQVSLGGDTRDTIYAAAEKSGMSVSTYMREAALVRATRARTAATPQELDALRGEVQARLGELSASIADLAASDEALIAFIERIRRRPAPVGA